LWLQIVSVVAAHGKQHSYYMVMQGYLEGMCTMMRQPATARALLCCAVQVGIEECLHIEFEYDKARYHLKVRR
jgi:hypothetical protein